jgi:CheY-like chemotaxis protein
MSAKVLVVENDLTARWTLAQRFEDLGVYADSAANGFEALHALNKNSYDLIFTDVEMSDMDGFEFTRLAREQEASKGRQVTVIAMSARYTRVTCLAAGMDDFATKPVTADELNIIWTRWASRFEALADTVSSI